MGKNKIHDIFIKWRSYRFRWFVRFFFFLFFLFPFIFFLPFSPCYAVNKTWYMFQKQQRALCDNRGTERNCKPIRYSSYSCSLREIVIIIIFGVYESEGRACVTLQKHSCDGKITQNYYRHQHCIDSGKHIYILQIYSRSVCLSVFLIFCSQQWRANTSRCKTTKVIHFN